MKLLPLLLLALFTFPGTSGRAQKQEAKAKEIIAEVVAEVGGMDGLHALKDVQYNYTKGNGTSLERYIFDGEVSYGSSTDGGTTKRQFFDGQNTKMWVNGQEIMDEKQLASANFSRKTNYYWLTMMQKMSDPGLVYEYGGKREYEGIEYDLVDVTFNDGVGVAKDRYLLYVNPHTKLVDLFLFTVMAFDKESPTLMKYTYGTFPGGVKLPVVSQSHSALNWEGDLDPDKKWGARWRTDFSFNNGFTKENIYRD